MTRYAIYHSDAYYPDAEFYNTKEDAMKAWEMLKKQRLKTDPEYLDTDFVCEIIEEVTYKMGDT